MPKEEWGVKRICPTTGKRFYDLNRSPIVSPYTGEIVELEVPGRKSTVQPEVVKAKPVRKEADDDGDVLIDDDDVAVDDETLLDDEDDDTVSFDELSDVADDEEE